MKCPVCSHSQIIPSFCIGSSKILKCNRCNVEFLNTYRENRSFYYTDKYYESWNLKEFSESTEQIKKMTFSSLFRLIQNGKRDFFLNKQLIDIGCATGYLLDVAQEMGCCVYGVELSEWACEQAKVKHKNVFNQPLEKCLFMDDYFDIITMTDIFEHIADPHIFFKEIARILKPNGYIIITSPDNLSLSRKILREKWFQFKDEHVIYYNKKGLSFLLEKYNLKLLTFVPHKKVMCLDYLYTQFSTYRVFIISRLLSFLYKRLSSRLTRTPFTVPISGEFAAVVKKK